MADTITISNGVIQIIPAAGGISSFDIATYFPGGIKLSGINFYGSAGTDVLKVRDKSATGTFLAPSIPDGDYAKFDPPIWCFPYILSTDLTLGTPANCIIQLFFV